MNEFFLTKLNILSVLVDGHEFVKKFIVALAVLAPTASQNREFD